MAQVRINELGLVIPGQVVRKHDATANETTLIVTQEQAREMYEALGEVLAFFEQQRAVPVSGDVADTEERR